MSPSTENGDHPQLFSVVGAAYVPERRTEPEDQKTRLHDVHPSEAAMAFVWLAFYLLVIGVSVVANGGVEKMVGLAMAMLQ